MQSDADIQLEGDRRGVILPVRANAGARRNGIIGIRNGALRVAVTAAPEKGKANRAIIEVLSKSLNIPKSSIELLSGETSPQKRFLLVGADASAVRAAIADVAS
jgi:uncharacterized protein (TIGR00251 family)